MSGATELKGINQWEDEPSKVFKVLVLGDSGVGKTCICHRLKGAKVDLRTQATVGVDYVQKRYNIDGESVTIQIWDTAGQERFRSSLLNQYYRSADAVVFVYDVTKITTFQNIPNWMDECSRHIDLEATTKAIIGNKCDMESRVNVEMVRKFADMHKMASFETSAMDPTYQNHIGAIFDTLAFKLFKSKDWPQIALKKPNGICISKLFSPFRYKNWSCC